MTRIRSIRGRSTVLACGIVALFSAWLAAAEPALPVVEGVWVRPAETWPALPLWGHAEGLRIGLWPLPGPRGLLRVYAPYLGHGSERMVNYIAVEPILAGELKRSYSELEVSQLDGTPGLRLWSADAPGDGAPRDPVHPARGVVERMGDVETLTVYTYVEPFRSGAGIMLRVRFRSDRPHEVALATFTQAGSEPLAACVVTATMGNYARLRVLSLRDGTVHAAELWPTYSGSDFTPRVCFGLDRLLRTPEGDVRFPASPDEADPATAAYAPGTFVGWKYSGDAAIQAWRSENPAARLLGCVNARTMYWASRSPIPGGISFENFELVEPFREGAEVWFAVEPRMSPVWRGPLETSDPALMNAVPAELRFVPDPGVRIDHAGLASPSYDEASGLFYLYYEDEVSREPRVAVSADGLSFPAGDRPTEWRHDPRVLRLPDPDEPDRTIYRRYLRLPDSSFVSESSYDGEDFVCDDGIRYRPRPEDIEVGVYDHFVDAQGGVVLLYIGDMRGENNVRRAVSPPGDNGRTFVFDGGNVLGDGDAGGGPNSYVDQKSILLPDGRRRLFAMQQGAIYSFISDDGRTFDLEPGVRLRPEDFPGLRILSLHDPWPALLPDGRIRLYFHGLASDGISRILSATSIGSIDVALAAAP